MDRLTERLASAEAAVASLEALVGNSPLPPLERDAAILRFQYSLEAVWKAAQHLLRDVEGIESGSPKQAIRDCVEAGLVDGSLAERGLLLVDDRNLTVHTYNEALALRLAARLPDHAAALREWLSRLQMRATQTTDPAGKPPGRRGER